MTEMKKTALIGAGALGVMYGQKLTETFGKERVCFAADEERIRKYKAEGLFCNGKPCEFRFVPAGFQEEKADLVIFATKYTGLEQAMESVRGLIGPETILLSLLNGVTSEEKLAERFGPERVIYCVAQEMDATKTENRVEYRSSGCLLLGEKDGRSSGRPEMLAEFLEKAGIRARIPEDIRKAQWEKLVFNVGLNQSAAVYRTNYGGVQKPGPARDTMIAAMREAVQAAETCGIGLEENTVDKWLAVLERMNPEGMPSMSQDIRDRRPTEVELFSGTICRLGRKYHFPTPVNDWLYERILEIEKSWQD